VLLVPEAGIEPAQALWTRGILSSIPTPRLSSANCTHRKNLKGFGSQTTDADSR